MIIEPTKEDLQSGIILFEVEDDAKQTDIPQVEVEPDITQQTIKTDVNSILFDIEEPEVLLSTVEEPAMEYSTMKNVEVKETVIDDAPEEKTSVTNNNLMKSIDVEAEEIVEVKVAKRKSKPKAAKRKLEPQQLGFLFDGMD